ncbi:hypothetical protein PQX77_001407 [Marasmius sp. AFHP31]|nr:hypothetical protein PQX77_001407 [Marasmius sp. AFHP31]
MQKERKEYTLKSSFTGFANSITSLKFSNDGKYLAVCSLDPLITVYRTDDGNKVSSFTTRIMESPESAPLVVVWGLEYELIVGTRDGRVIRYPDAHRSPSSLAILRWITAGPEKTPALLCEIKPPPFEYTPIRFDMKDPSPVNVLIPQGRNEVIVCYLDHGIRFAHLHCCSSIVLQPFPGAIKSLKIIRLPLYRGRFPPTAESALSPNSASIAAWNLYDGIDIYSTRRAYLRDIDTINFDFPTSNDVNMTQDIQYIRAGKEILVGSNFGQPFIINATTKELAQVLDHTKAKVAYWSRDDLHLIATGDRDRGQDTCVKLWHIAPPYNWWNLLYWVGTVARSRLYWRLIHVVLFCLIARMTLGSLIDWRSLVSMGVFFVGIAGQAVADWAQKGSTGLITELSLQTQETASPDTATTLHIIQSSVMPLLATVTSTVVITQEQIPSFGGPPKLLTIPSSTCSLGRGCRSED